MKTNLFSRVLVVCCLVALGTACTETKKPLNLPTTDLAETPFIPVPTKVVATHSAFALDQNTAIFTQGNDEGFKAVGKYLSEKIQTHTQLRLPVNEVEGSVVERMIYINQADGEDLAHEEAYQLQITRDTLIINAKSAAGAFRGVQTLRQMLPLASNDTITEHPLWLIPTGKIVDAPQFEYRGSMLDVARHFFSVDDVKKYIDLLAYYKYNVLHLHLADDQGWRIEIKKWPKLTEIGGSTEVGGGDGGFYTQEEFKDIVAYAAAQHIMVIPEIDMPGHTNAASVSYPFLNGNGKPIELYTGTHVGFSTFDTRKDTVYSFIDDVIEEIVAISPAPYFHIGGDESHVTKKADYKYFVERVEKIVQKHGKRMIGWDEVANTAIDSTSIAQYWSSPKNAQAAVKKGMQVILSPANKAYLDMQYDLNSEYGLHWAGYIPVDTAYIWTPEKHTDGLPLENILGIEAPLWSETISTISELEYLAFPRAIGYGELAWSTEENRDWESYKVRLAKQAPFLEKMNVNYYPSSLIDWETQKTSKEILKD